MRKLLAVVTILTAAATFASCGTEPDRTPVAATGEAPGTADEPGLGNGAKRTPPLKSPDLTITLDPTSGPPGTVVSIEATGCNDPTGLNHAVSFNNDPRNRTDRFSPDVVRTIASDQRGQRLFASYTVQPADRRAGNGTFVVQCSDGVATADFTVTAH